MTRGLWGEGAWPLTRLGLPFGNSSGPGGGRGGIIPGSEHPVTRSMAMLNPASQIATAKSTQLYSRATSGTTSTQNTTAGPSTRSVVPTSDDHAGPATSLPPQKKVCVPRSGWHYVSGQPRPYCGQDASRCQYAAGLRELSCSSHIISSPVLVEFPPLRLRHAARRGLSRAAS